MSLDTMIILLSRQHNERLLYFDLLVFEVWRMRTALHLALSLPSIITHKIWIKCHTGNLYSFDPSILIEIQTYLLLYRQMNHIP